MNALAFMIVRILQAKCRGKTLNFRANVATFAGPQNGTPFCWSFKITPGSCALGVHHEPAGECSEQKCRGKDLNLRRRLANRFPISRLKRELRSYVQS